MSVMAVQCSAVACSRLPWSAVESPREESVSRRGSRSPRIIFPFFSFSSLNFFSKKSVSPRGAATFSGRRGLQTLPKIRKMDSVCVDASATSEICQAHEVPSSSAVTEGDLLVVGPGVLGSLIGTGWLQALGISPVTKQLQSREEFPFVVFCAPPSGSEDYAAEVRVAAQRWNGKGTLLFTSSSAVYDISDNGPCDESAPILAKGRSPRVDVLLNAEEEVLKVGGNVMRLAGLYAIDRGAHSYWLKKGTVDARPDHVLNVIHYEDAASLCLAILKGKSRSQVFMGCDGSPVSRQDMMGLAMQSGKFEGNFQGFTGTDGALGKKMDNSATRTVLGWQPKYASFASFLGLS